MSAPVKFVGMPSGPKAFVKELGIEVGTFLEAPGGKFPALEYHVPLKMRGPYRLKDLPYKSNMRTDDMGWVLCQRFTAAGEKCSKKAQNRSLACDSHGGRLHPLDKLVKDDETPDSARESESLSRYRQFQAGQITVDDLDDEELATCGFRAKNGRIYKPRNVPREMAQAFTKAIYERAQQELKGHTVAAAQTVAEIMLNKNIEPDIRLKAANTLLDRGLGKAPQVVALTADSSFEQVFEGIFSGPRNQRPTVIDAEVVEPSIIDEHAPNDNVPALASGESREHAGNSGVTERDSEATEPNSYDARLSARNPAILAQTVEIKPFEYDLSDKSEEIKKATRKRYASRALGDDFVYVRETLPNGMYRHIPPKVPKSQSNSKTQARKAYTLSDFS